MTVSKHAYAARERDELSFAKGAVIYVLPTEVEVKAASAEFCYFLFFFFWTRNIRPTNEVEVRTASVAFFFWTRRLRTCV